MYQVLYIRLKRFIIDMICHKRGVGVWWLSFWVVSLVIGMGSAAKVSGIVIITPENVD